LDWMLALSPRVLRQGRPSRRVGMRPAKAPGMIKIIGDLLALQELQWRKGKGASEREIETLRKAVPQPILDHYDRLAVRGKKGVAILRNGVCTECHMRVPLGTLVTLARGQDVQLCGNCGRYLFLPAGETVAGARLAAPTAVPRGRKGARAPVAAA
jgi:hypothetical protein